VFLLVIRSIVSYEQGLCVLTLSSKCWLPLDQAARHCWSRESLASAVQWQWVQDMRWSPGYAAAATSYASRCGLPAPSMMLGTWHAPPKLTVMLQSDVSASVHPTTLQPVQHGGPQQQRHRGGACQQCMLPCSCTVKCFGLWIWLCPVLSAAETPRPLRGLLPEDS
jgi:hypothetical protein